MKNAMHTPVLSPNSSDGALVCRNSRSSMDRQIKPLFVLPNLEGGGAERVVLELLSRLDRQYFDPTLFLFERFGALWPKIPPGIRVTAAADEIAPGLRQRFLRLPSRFRGLLICALRSDIIVGALELNATYQAYLAGALTRKPVVGWMHTDVEHILDDLRGNPEWHRRAIAWIYPRLSRIVCVSSGSARSLQTLAVIRPERLSIINNPINVENLARMAKEPLPAWARRVFAKPTVLGAGRMVRLKGFDLLIKAHARLREEGLDHHLLIAGEGPLRESLLSLARSVGVETTVFMPGWISNPYPLIKTAQLVSVPSRYEGLPTLILEALALGTPVVAADCASGPSEILEGGRYGLLVPPENPSVLAESISRLLRSPALRQNLASQGYTRAQAFAPANIVPRWERLLREAVKGSKVT